MKATIRDKMALTGPLAAAGHAFRLSSPTVRTLGSHPRLRDHVKEFGPLFVLFRYSQVVPTDCTVSQGHIIFLALVQHPL